MTLCKSVRDPNATNDEAMHPTSTTSTSHQSSSSHMAQHVLSLISVFLLYVSSFHLHNCFISWGLVSDTILIKFIFSLPCNLFWCITANHSQREITAGCSKYCCDGPLRHKFPVVHRNPYSSCTQRQYYSSGKNKQTNKQRKPEISMIAKLPVFPGCLVWQLWMYSLAGVLTGLGWEGGPGAHLRRHVVSSAILQLPWLFPCAWVISQIELQNSSCNKLWI